MIESTACRMPETMAQHQSSALQLAEKRPASPHIRLCGREGDLGDERDLHHILDNEQRHQQRLAARDPSVRKAADGSAVAVRREKAAQVQLSTVTNFCAGAMTKRQEGEAECDVGPH